MHCKKNTSFFKDLSVFLTAIFFFTSITAFSQSDISGKVVDSTGSPLVGATVKIKGTSVATKTNEQGLFSLKGVTTTTPVLAVSYVGFADKEINPATGDLVITLTEKLREAQEVIVTGVFDKRTALQSSIAISTLKSDAISKLAPNSAADLLSYTPGVYVNSAVGEINNTVFSRGVNANQFSIAGGNGYYYVSLMEDGLPVSNLSSGNIVADYFYRADATLSRLESVRGGSAS